jgi:hypothetical protein
VLFQRKRALPECSPRASCIWNKKLEGLGFLLLKKLKISSEDMYPTTPEYIYPGSFVQEELG